MPALRRRLLDAGHDAIEGAQVRLHARDDDVGVGAGTVEHAAAIIAHADRDVTERIDALGHRVHRVLEQLRGRARLERAGFTPARGADERVDRLVRGVDRTGADRRVRADLAAPLDFAVGPFRGAIGRAAGRRPSATADRPLRRAAGIAFAVFADPVFRLEFTVLVILAFLAVLIPLTTFDFAVVLAAARDLARSGAVFARVFGATRRERGFSPARGFFAAVVRDGLALERAVACFVDFAAGLAALRAAGAALLAAFLGFTLATTLRIF